MNIKNSILIRVRLAFIVVFLFGLAIILRIVDIQFFEGSNWMKIASEIGLKYRTVKATRGNIYSDNGSLIATSLPFYRLAFDPSIPTQELFKKNIDSLAIQLSHFFKDKQVKDYKRIIQNARISGRKYLILNNRKINYQEKKQLQQWPIFREGRMAGGVIFEKAETRLRPFALSDRTIGFINENNKGAGLEYSFNQYLAGKDGQALFQKMAGGNWKPVYDESTIRPEDGYDIASTININIQDVTESALNRALIQHDADYGCAVVMETATGEIKAISNLSKVGTEKYRERYNYAVGDQGLTEPGSTFKLVTMMALMQENPELILDDTIATGNGSYRVYDRIIRDTKPTGYGNISIKDAFAKSSNIAMAKLVKKQFGLNPQNYIDYIHKMGISKPLDFQIMGEGTPYIKSPKDASWSGISLLWMSYGYELKLTPLQTLAFYNAIANNGVYLQPIIVKKIIKADKEVVHFKPQVVNPKICSEQTLQNARQLLEAVVENGTASNIKESHYKIAGKTGTAQKLINGKYSRKYYTSFVGYFPAEKPKYSCIVVIDNPKGYKQYGSDVAAPVFKEIADKIYASDIAMHTNYPVKYTMAKGIFPVIQAGHQFDLELICKKLGISQKSNSHEEWVRAQRNDNYVAWQSNKHQSDLMPNVNGMTLRDALFILENQGLHVIYKGTGRVKSQSIPVGNKFKKGSTILLKLG